MARTRPTAARPKPAEVSSIEVMVLEDEEASADAAETPVIAPVPPKPPAPPKPPVGKVNPPEEAVEVAVLSVVAAPWSSRTRRRTVSEYTRTARPAAIATKPMTISLERMKKFTALGPAGLEHFEES